MEIFLPGCPPETAVLLPRICQRNIRRQIAHHVGKLGALGFEVTLSRIPEPGPGGTGNNQAA
jgi:hypothetical protein